MRTRALQLAVARLASIVVATALMVGCETTREPFVVLTLRSASPGTPLGVVDASALAPGATLDGLNRVRLPLAELPASIELSGFCPHALTAPAPERSGGDLEIDVALEPLVDIPLLSPVGHDAPFRIEVAAGCREALAGSIEWSVISVADGSMADVALAVDNRGFVVTGRTPRLEARAEPSWGIVPVSARTSGQVVLRMRWSHAGGAAIERTVRVLAAARATGLPSVPLGADVLLRGGPFVVRERPPGSLAEVSPSGDGLERLSPDARGRWLLGDASGRSLAVRVGEHVATPLDCGRSDCHARETEHALASPMTGALLARVAEPCATACHATGEPGLPDGGFAHVARELGWIPPTDASVDALAALPRPLRRLAGVGCTACHGPGAIPEDGARWAILRSDVCATCHDAPPRYGHVAAWATSAMSRSDASGETRAAACADCHTTAGFLAAIGARAATDVPADAGPLGIACAACHAPHSAQRLEHALVRQIETPAVLGSLPTRWAGSTSTVCLGCHAPRADERAALASSAAILLGRGGVRVADGTPLVASAAAGRAVHADVTCIECHGAPGATAALGIERGASHAFAVDRARCVACHVGSGGAVGDEASATELARRAAALAAALHLTADDHASGAPASPWTAAGRAVRNLRLVLGDPGAWAHAPGYATALLDEAERAVE